MLRDELPRQRNDRLDQIERERDADDNSERDEQILPPICTEVTERSCRSSVRQKCSFFTSFLLDMHIRVCYNTIKVSAPDHRSVVGFVPTAHQEAIYLPLFFFLIPVCRRVLAKSWLPGLNRSFCSGKTFLSLKVNFFDCIGFWQTAESPPLNACSSHIRRIDFYEPISVFAPPQRSSAAVDRSVKNAHFLPQFYLTKILLD